MRALDRFLQSWRIRKARPWIPGGARVLDIGCHQGELFQSLGEQIGPSVGYDPLANSANAGRHSLVPEIFSQPSSFPDACFDVVIMLATLEHVQDKAPLAREFFRILRPRGRVIVTVPSSRVDTILGILHRFGLIEGMSLEEHHGFDPRTTPEIFAPHGFQLERRARFQLGLNYLFVFRRPE
jgi:ubiquinone/menaquinone biosynthesis C-methylase UbiE